MDNYAFGHQYEDDRGNTVWDLELSAHPDYASACKKAISLRETHNFKVMHEITIFRVIGETSQTVEVTINCPPEET